MRDKEAIENERKNLIRNLEKQAKVVEKLMASERSLRDQLVRHPTHFVAIVQLKPLPLEHPRSISPGDARSDRRLRRNHSGPHY